MEGGRLVGQPQGACRTVVWPRDGGGAPEALVRMAAGPEAGSRGQNCPPQALCSSMTAKLEVSSEARKT